MRIMAIDYGDAHTGVAVSDLTGLLAGYACTIHSRRRDEVIRRIGELIGEYGVTELVLGHPRNMDGTLGPRAEKAESFAGELEAAFGLPVRLWDERRTTIDAHNILAASGKNAKKRKQTVDAVAASLILEGYLQFQRNRGE
ncbi:MAG: Holliday junction resolvase RuvX [Oscillospiraceae bacterium]|jgi:putative Holliday junction resolvase|nr:Holliday junction resolvase RuvX [Oscillospiraceae bacterium]